MSEDKPAPDQPDKATASVQRMGREEIFNVFRSEGGNEFSGQHRQHRPVADNDAASGPIVSRSMEDASTRRDSKDITDAEGPSSRREMLDSTGPVVARRLDGTYGSLPQNAHTEVNLRQSEDPIHAASGSGSPAAVHLETFTLNMEDRLAQMKASQKEMLEKMRQLEEENLKSEDAASEKNQNPLPKEEPAPSPIAKLSGESTRRHILDELRIYPGIRKDIANNHRNIVEEVMEAMSRNQVVVVGMAGNPFVSNTRKLLRGLAIDHAYLQYGSYFSQWRKRNALKMWTGWPTFPMVFINGILVGGYQNLKTLSDSEELQRLLNDQSAAE